MRALRISLLLQRSLHVLWVGRLCCCFCIIEVHEAGTSLKCLTIKVGLLFFKKNFVFFSPQIAFGAVSGLQCCISRCKMWWNAGAITTRGLHVSTHSYILPDFKDDKGYACLLTMANNTWTILNKFSLLPLCSTTSVWREHELYQLSFSGGI